MKFHDELNDKIWDIENDNQIIPEVKDKLLEIANAFIEYLEIPQDAILDMVITGSSASYNYNKHSDLDLHIIVDYDKIHEDCPLVEGYLGALKNTFNKEHDIYIHGVPVELYAEQKDQGTVHNGLYSLQTGWIDKPQKIEPTDNDAAVEAKYQEIKDMVDKCDDSEAADELLEKIYNMRKAGLAEAGEFCTENLAFKKLRNEGCMDKLRQLKKEQIDKQLSLESYNENKEDYPKDREELIDKYNGVFKKNGIILEISNLYNKKEDNFSGGFGKSYSVDGKVFNKFEKAIEYMKKLNNKNESIKENIELPMDTPNEPYIEVEYHYGRQLLGYRLIDGILYYSGRNGTKQIGKNVTLDNLAKRILSHAKNHTGMDIEKITVDDKVIWDLANGFINESIKEKEMSIDKVIREALDCKEPYENKEEIDGYNLCYFFGYHYACAVYAERKEDNRTVGWDQYENELYLEGPGIETKRYELPKHDELTVNRETVKNMLSSILADGELENFPVAQFLDAIENICNDILENYPVYWDKNHEGNREPLKEEAIYNPSLILQAYKKEQEWLKSLNIDLEEEQAPEIMLFVIEDKEIKDTKLVNRKDVYTYKPEENEYYLDMTRDSGDVLTDYNLEPAQKLVDRWNEGKKQSDMMKEELEPVYHYSVEDIDQRGDDFDNAEEAYEQAKEQLSKLGYEVKELNDDGEFEVLSPSTGVAYPGVIYPSNPELDEDVNTLCDKIDTTNAEMKNLIKSLKPKNECKLEESLNKVIDEALEE